jgi:hypothetical protein
MHRHYKRRAESVAWIYFLQGVLGRTHKAYFTCTDLQVLRIFINNIPDTTCINTPNVPRMKAGWKKTLLAVSIHTVACWGTWPLLNTKCDVLGTGDAVRIVTSFSYDFISRHYNPFYNVLGPSDVASRSWPGSSALVLWSPLIWSSLICLYLPPWSVFICLPLWSGLVSYLLQSGGVDDTFLKDFVSRLS